MVNAAEEGTREGEGVQRTVLTEENETPFSIEKSKYEKLHYTEHKQS